MYELTCKLTPENNFSFRKFVGHGCGTLRRKCKAWAENLVSRGCTHIVVIHDLDQHNEADLRELLLNSINGVSCRTNIILIPVYEIEAWLLADPEAIKTTFGMQKVPRIPRNPETIINPKEKLREIVWRGCKRHYVNTIHNRKIASHVRVARLSVCRSFRNYPEFIDAQIN